jgi:HAD superfamily hydrolase (TIGR01509 family)
MTELVIFDCDGVLVDSEPISVRIDVEMLAEVGVTMSEEEVIERFVGRSPEVILAETEAQLGRQVPEGWFERGEARLRRAFAAELKPVAGIEETLAAIDVPVCVASSSGHENLRFKLELTGLYERFAGHIFSAAEVANGKPAPDLFLHAARQMGVDPSACAVVEDSRYGVQAARAAGMDVLGYAGGLTPAAALEGPRTVVFDDMRTLPQLLAPGRSPHSATPGCGSPGSGSGWPRSDVPATSTWVTRPTWAGAPTSRRWSTPHTRCSTRLTPAGCATSTPPAPMGRPRPSSEAGSRSAGWAAKTSRSAPSGATRTPRTGAPMPRCTRSRT